VLIPTEEALWHHVSARLANGERPHAIQVFIVLDSLKPWLAFLRRRRLATPAGVEAALEVVGGVKRDLRSDTEETCWPDTVYQVVQAWSVGNFDATV
jgi:hypothetical protein